MSALTRREHPLVETVTEIGNKHGFQLAKCTTLSCLLTKMEIPQNTSPEDPIYSDSTYQLLEEIGQFRGMYVDLVEYQGYSTLVTIALE